MSNSSQKLKTSVFSLTVHINDEDSICLKKGSKYIILNPDGGSKDVYVYTGEHYHTFGEVYYSWDRFVSIEEYRESQIDKITSS